MSCPVGLPVWSRPWDVVTPVARISSLDEVAVAVVDSVVVVASVVVDAVVVVIVVVVVAVYVVFAVHHHQGACCCEVAFIYVNLYIVDFHIFDHYICDGHYFIYGKTKYNLDWTIINLSRPIYGTLWKKKYNLDWTIINPSRPIYVTLWKKKYNLDWTITNLSRPIYGTKWKKKYNLDWTIINPSRVETNLWDAMEEKTKVLIKSSLTLARPR